MSSWITGLADKAENILNKIDQNAATALQIPAEENPLTLGTVKHNLSPSTLKTMLSPDRKSFTASGTLLNQEDIIHTMVTSTSSSDINRIDEEYVNLKVESLNSSRGSINTPMNLPRNNPPESAEVNAEYDGPLMKSLENSRCIEQQRIEQFEDLIKSLSEERDEANRFLSKAETENMAYVHTNSELEANLAKLQQEYVSTVKKLQIQTQETNHQREELSEYRIKATKALQSKDALIAELKSAKGDTLQSPNNEARLLQFEYAALKQEHQTSLEEIQKIRMQLDDYQRLGKEHEMQLVAARESEISLSNELRSAREHSITIESEQRVLTQELNTLRQQLSNQMAASATRLQEKDQQLLQLRRANIDKENRGSNKSVEDYEARIKTLTQSLVERQSTLENVTAERNALRLQFEQVQLQMQKFVNNQDIEHARINTRNSLLSNSTDDVKAQFPLLMHPNPFDNRVARRVKRAYSSLDSAGIRLGAFLRRYPLMRIFVLIYVALLHLWVMFVLLSSTPN